MSGLAVLDASVSSAGRSGGVNATFRVAVPEVKADPTSSPPGSRAVVVTDAVADSGTGPHRFFARHAVVVWSSGRSGRGRPSGLTMIDGQPLMLGRVQWQPEPWRLGWGFR